MLIATRRMHGSVGIVIDTEFQILFGLNVPYLINIKPYIDKFILNN